jgi:hypothetical protein
LAERRLQVVAVLALSVVVVLALALHLARRTDLLDDVVAAPPTGEWAVAKLTHARTAFRVSRTTVRRPGDVALRVSASDASASDTSIAIQILGPNRKAIAACRYPRGSFGDTTVLRCPVRDLSRVRRVRITTSPVTRGLGVVGGKPGVGWLLAPRSQTLPGRFETLLGRIGAKHPAPFSGWLVPIGTALWLSVLLLVGLWILRSPRDDG